MADHHTPAPVDPQAVEVSQCIWHGFTKAAFLLVVGISVLLAAMAAFLLH